MVFLGLLVLFAVFLCAQDQLPYMGFVTTPSLEGSKMSLAEARAALRFPVGELPAVSLKGCDGRSRPIRLYRADVKDQSVILSYTHGLWMSIGPGRPLRENKIDREVTEGQVRGQPGAITRLGRPRDYFFCPKFSCSGGVINTVDGAGEWFPLGAEITWIENGQEIHLQGPFPDAVLIGLAEDLRFR